MTLEICKSSIKEYVLTQSKGQYIPLSKLTSLAWWESKASCVSDFGGVANVKTYVESLDLNQRVETTDDSAGLNTETTTDASDIATHEVAQVSSQTDISFIDYIKEQIGRSEDTKSEVIENKPTTSTKTSDSAWWVKTTSGLIKGTTQLQPRYSMDNLWSYAMDGLYIIVGLLALYVILHFMKTVLQLLYDYFNAHRIIYFRVILPRWDSKGDREKERELSKDMKEKIGRMSQVFRSMHRLWELWVIDSLANRFFSKAKFMINLHYEKSMVVFVIWTYPEYQDIIGSSISAQYSDSSIETIEKPNFFKEKYWSIAPLEPKKDPVYPIKTFKQIEDDPLNNIIDSMGELGDADTFDIVIHARPLWSSFNRKAQRWAEWLYRNDKNFIQPEGIFKKLLYIPFGIFDFVLFGKKKEMPGNNDKYQEWGKDFVRMTKAKEDAVNAMGEEAGRHAFSCNMYLMSSSAEPDRPKANIRNMVWIFNIFKDEFNNELDLNEWKVDIFWFILKPIRRFMNNIGSVAVLHKTNIFTENQLTTLYHFPDGAFNRSPSIKWMDYKVLSAPDNLYRPKEPTEYVMSWSITEWYLWGKIPKLFTKEHWAYAETIDKIDNLIPFDPVLHAKVDPALIVSNEQGKFVKETIEKHRSGLKMYKDATLLWVNVHRNQFEPVYMKRKDRSRHHYIIWKSWWGKSVLLWFMARQDAWNGDGFCVVDPHGDLVEDILTFIPASRAKDVIYFDAGNEERPIGLNLYNINNANEADRVVNDATDMFLKMFGPEVFGPRLQEYFKFGSLTLLEDLEEGATLLDIPRLFTDEAFREYKTSKVKNPVVRNFRERTYASIGDREKEEIIPYLTAKFVSFTTNSLIRNIIWQTKSVFNFRKIMDEWKILLVNLSKGKIGDLNTQLLGMIIVWQISNGAMSRADTPEDKRRDFYLYVDEFQNFVTNTFADILSEARKYHLSLIMAHQYIAQLDGGWSNNIGETSGGKKSVKDAVFGNVGTIQSFKIGAPDAEFLEKEYAPVLTGQDIIWISNFKTYVKLNIDNATSRVFSLDTIWSQDYENKKVRDVLKQYSALKYGRDRKYVEAEIGARIGINMEDQSAEALEAAAENADTQTQPEAKQDEQIIPLETPVEEVQISEEEATWEEQAMEEQTIEQDQIAEGEQAPEQESWEEQVQELDQAEEQSEEANISEEGQTEQVEQVTEQTDQATEQAIEQEQSTEQDNGSEVETQGSIAQVEQAQPAQEEMPVQDNNWDTQNVADWSNTTSGDVQSNNWPIISTQNNDKNTAV